jgi:cytochrome c peroxidase
MKMPALLLLILVLMAAMLRPGPVRSQAVPPAVPLHPVAPADNPTTPAKVALGRLLFWDPILSGHQDVACATCHHPDFGYSDGLGLSIGVNGTGVGNQRRFVAGTLAHLAKRNSQTVLNTGFNGQATSGATGASTAPMFWDLRVSGLEAQALEPIKSAEEMRGDVYTETAAVETVVARLRAIPNYVTQFNTAFGGGKASVTALNLSRALAAFERTLVAVDSPYDRYLRGDRSAMTATQIAGMEAFARTGCSGCHSGPMFSDYKTHVLGAPENSASPVLDGGMNGTRAFRTPSLRNLAATGPYMHSGALGSLDDVLRFYNRAVRGQGRGRGRNNTALTAVDSRPQTDPLLRELRGVRRNSEEIKAFLLALNDDRFDRIIPAHVPSGLRPGGRID